MSVLHQVRTRYRCAECDLRDRRFCSVPVIHETMSAAAVPVTYPRGSTLFMEGEPSRGVFVICEGRVKLTTTSAEGRSLIVRIAETGAVIGVGATVISRPYETTAEAVEPTTVHVLPKDAFMAMTSGTPQAALTVARELSDMYDTAQRDLRRLALSQNTSERLIRLLLDWGGRNGESGPGGMRLHVAFTHDELAQMIGTTRETVTRALGDLRRRKALIVRGATFYLDVAALKALLE
jgi:CRP/FNR family transcriptional regulator, cyclic AMP receptor protein